MSETVENKCADYKIEKNICQDSESGKDFESEKRTLEDLLVTGVT